MKIWSILQVPSPLHWVQSKHNSMVPVQLAWPPCTYVPAGSLFMHADTNKITDNSRIFFFPLLTPVTHMHTFPQADSVITFPVNPIDSIRLECCSNVSLASGPVSCCGNSAACVNMETHAHTRARRTVSQVHLQDSLCPVNMLSSRSAEISFGFT